MSIACLPSELWHRVIRHLTIMEDTCSLAMVSKYFYKLVEMDFKRECRNHVVYRLKGETWAYAFSNLGSRSYNTIIAKIEFYRDNAICCPFTGKIALALNDAYVLLTNIDFGLSEFTILDFSSYTNKVTRVNMINRGTELLVHSVTFVLVYDLVWMQTGKGSVICAWTHDLSVFVINDNDSVVVTGYRFGILIYSMKKRRIVFCNPNDDGRVRFKTFNAEMKRHLTYQDSWVEARNDNYPIWKLSRMKFTVLGSLKEIVNYSFGHRLSRNATAIGRFDENSGDTLVAGTSSNKVILQNSEAIFHVNEPITWIDVLHQPSKQYGFVSDLVIVGTEKSLIVFDVYNNKTMFHRDMPEGITCIKIGHLDEHKENVIVCGCGSTIWGIDFQGEDVFWTALGDDVNSIDLCDIDYDGMNELIVGSNGTEIKVLKQQSLLKDLIEGDPCVMIKTMGEGTFAFGLNSGVIGVYRKWERLWRIKTKHKIANLLIFPTVAGDDKPYLCCVWQNGKIDVRDTENGENYLKTQLDGEVSGSVVQRRDNQMDQLLVTYFNGRVRGVELNPDYDEAEDEIEVLHEYGQRKHNLMEELKNYEAAESGDRNQIGIPLNTQMDCVLELTEERGLLLHVHVTNDIPIKAILLFAEGIFHSECFSIHANEETSDMFTIIKPVKNTATDILMRVIIGAQGSTQLRVLEFDQSLPKFSTYVYMEKGAPAPEGYVDLEFSLRLDLLNRWLATHFLINEGMVLGMNDEQNWKVSFRCCYSKEVLQIEVIEGRLFVRHNFIEVVGEVVQSIVQSMEVKQMSSRAFFPKYQEQLVELIASMEDRYTTNDKLMAEWTERLNFIRETVVRAEDALVTDQTSKARKLYVRVAMLNRECVAQRQILMASVESLVTSLKKLNLLIKQNSQLKIGEDAHELVKECRKLLAAENFAALGKRLQVSGN
ncbi:unnamed protein product [Bursaphelenchus okinawaensis]|uniref:F-box domain-containing protein n=1 Tax=Bursaphelenchus okinawaensis TaxID=465554 RepID=A0A811KU91_9BILA|nr:unnamed protein product [Bursaphelenchus okinawaensis]CAG9112285.1 unnamed protein product [Bursaphelenchus okinawaensis]